MGTIISDTKIGGKLTKIYGRKIQKPFTSYVGEVNSSDSEQKEPQPKNASTTGIRFFETLQMNFISAEKIFCDVRNYA